MWRVMSENNNYQRRKTIKIPDPSELLAEFIGIFLGDGSFRNKYQITISYNHRTEKGYAAYIRRIVYKLFGLRSNVRIRKKYGSAEAVVTSSNLVDYLRKETGLSYGNSRNQLILPGWISRNKKYKIGFIRGIFDSEGCVYGHMYRSGSKSYSYVKIAITNYCDKVLTAVYGFLADLKIHAVKYNNRVHIYSDLETRRFFKLIKSHNAKNKIRFKNSTIYRRGTQVV